MPDLSAQLRGIGGSQVVDIFEGKDERAGDPLRRYTLLLDDGDTLIVEQNHCRIENLSVSLASAKAKPTARSYRVISEAVQASGLWQQHFKNIHAETAIEQAVKSQPFAERLASGDKFTVGLNETISASADSSEVLMSYIPQAHQSNGEKSVLTISISVGGL